MACPNWRLSNNFVFFETMFFINLRDNKSFCYFYCVTYDIKSKMYILFISCFLVTAKNLYIIPFCLQHNCRDKENDSSKILQYQESVKTYSFYIIEFFSYDVFMSLSLQWWGLKARKCYCKFLIKYWSSN